MSSLLDHRQLLWRKSNRLLDLQSAFKHFKPKSRAFTTIPEPASL